MKRIAIILAIAAAAFSLASCAEPAADAWAWTGEPEPFPEALREMVAANRLVALPPPRADFAEASARLLTPNLCAEEDARVAAAVMQSFDRDLGRPESWLWSPTGAISRAEMEEDVRFVFDLLRYAYAGYQYFGGDDVFLPMRDSMIELIHRLVDPAPVSLFLQHVLAPPLRGAISDNHFFIYNQPLQAHPQVAYMSDAHELRMVEGDLVTEINGAPHRLVETTRGGQPVDAVLPTLSADGELVWNFGFVASAAGAMQGIAAVFECVRTGERTGLNVTLRIADGIETVERRPLLDERMEGRVAVIENGRMREDWEPGSCLCEYFEAFYMSGREARSNPVTILDLRGNSGGFASLPFQWMLGFTGNAPRCELSFASFSLGTATAAELLIANSPGSPDCPLDAYAPTVNMHVREFIDDQSLRWLHPAEFRPLETVRNENLVIVLMDWRVASAGEIFVAYLRSLENVVFVGTNTSGTLVTGGVISASLPNSGFAVSFGGILNLRPDLSQFEGSGFMPDLWVPSDESLERVLRFVERHGLAL